MNWTDAIVVYLFVVLGIAISIVVPILRKALPQPKQQGLLPQTLGPRISQVAKPYLVLAAFSLVTGIVVVVFFGDTLLDWKLALTAGFAWDSAVQKMGKS